jgi:Holliday junction DNA helicase RuvA
MIAYLHGRIDMIGDDFIVIDVNGVGYGVSMPIRALSKLTKNQEVKVLTYLYIREDLMKLYGFMETLEIRVFELLLGVSGVGPRTALAALSQCSCAEIIYSITNEEPSNLLKVPGIGKKTAQRIILDLKDKMGKLADFTEAPVFWTKDSSMGIIREAIEGLVGLGYNAKDIEGVVRSTAKELEDSLTVESLLSDVLRKLAPFGG